MPSQISALIVPLPLHPLSHTPNLLPKPPLPSPPLTAQPSHPTLSPQSLLLPLPHLRSLLPAHNDASSLGLSLHMLAPQIVHNIVLSINAYFTDINIRDVVAVHELDTWRIDRAWRCGAWLTRLLGWCEVVGGVQPTDVGMLGS